MYKLVISFKRYKVLKLYLCCSMTKGGNNVLLWLSRRTQQLVSIDLSDESPVMVFGPFPAPETDELTQALEILGVEVETSEAN